MKEVILHVDVGVDVGWGHLQETINIAKRLREKKIKYKFLIKENYKIKKYLESINHKVYFLKNLKKDIANKIILSNLFSIDEKYRKIISSSSKFWIVITEKKSEEIGDLNFNISSNPKYFPLGDIFTIRNNFNYRKNIKKIIISFGGSDPKNISLLILEFIRQGVERGEISKDIKIELILGTLFKFNDLILSAVKKFPLKCKVYCSLSHKKFKEKAQSSDIAITTGGGTMYEFCALGVPSIIIPILDKMEKNASFYKKKGSIILLGRSDKISANDLISAIKYLYPKIVRKKIGTKAKLTIDGLGVERICEEIEKVWKKLG